MSADADMEKLLERCWQKQEPKEKLLAQGGRVELLYWDPVSYTHLDVYKRQA